MESNYLHLMIVSPEKTLFDGNVEKITVPGSLGFFTVLPQHAPIISSLTKGDIKYTVQGEERFCKIKGGFIEVNENEVSVCIE